MRLLPKQETFFDMFDKQVDMVSMGAKCLTQLMADFSNAKDKAFKLHAMEHDADEIVHEIMKRLNMTFVTPLDREDIHALASALDDIMDFTYTAADRMVLYEVGEPTQEAIKLANILSESAELVAGAVRGLRDIKQPAVIREACVAVNRLENQGDHVNREALAALYHMHDKPIEALKWREIYGQIETAIDKCEDVADIIESIILKNA